MKADKKIYAPNWCYTALKWWVDRFVRLSFSQFDVAGTDNIPTDGAVVFVANHTCALMDALVILSSTKNKKVFMARADIFGKGFVARILQFLRIMPIYRRRDGLGAVRGNTASFDRAVEVLKHRVPLCIFAEGTHRPKHSLLPLTKGFARIALQALDQNGGKISVVPVGIEYEDYFSYRRSVCITYGKPIDVGQTVAECPDNDEAARIDLLRTKVTEQLRELIVWIADDDKYDMIIDGIDYSLPEMLLDLPPRQRRVFRVQTDLRIELAKRLQGMVARRKEQAKEFFGEVRETIDWLDAHHLSHDTLDTKRNGAVAQAAAWGILGTIAILIMLPFAAPVIVVCELLASMIKDRAFRNTARFGGVFVMVPLTSVAWFVIAPTQLYLIWWFAPLAFVFVPLASILTMEIWYRTRKALRNWRYAILLKKKER